MKRKQKPIWETLGMTLDEYARAFNRKQEAIFNGRTTVKLNLASKNKRSCVFMMIKRIIELLFGEKRPCGCAGRYRRKPGKNVTCPHCGNTYFRARLVCAKPRAAGMMVFREEIEEGVKL